VVEIAGLVALTSLVTSFVLRFMRLFGERKVVRVMMMERMHEAREAGTRPGLIDRTSLDARSED
jgi:hypothetical protein